MDEQNKSLLLTKAMRPVTAITLTMLRCRIKVVFAIAARIELLWTLLHHHAHATVMLLPWYFSLRRRLKAYDNGILQIFVPGGKVYGKIGTDALNSLSKRT